MAETKTDDPARQYSEIPELGVERGVGTQLAFTTPFRPMSLGISKTEQEELEEVLRDDLLEDNRPTVRQLVTMRRLDGHARALYRLLTLPIRASLNKSTFKPAGGGDKEAEFIDLVFNTAPTNGGMTNTFQRFMGQLLGSLFEGFSAFEKVFWVPTHGPLQGKITLKKLAWRPSDTVTFVQDKNGGFAGFRQRATNGGKFTDAYIDSEYAFYYAAQEDERKFYGVSFFESAFPHYDAKAKAYFTAHLAAQRAAVGTRVGTVPLNASTNAKREFATSLGNLALAQWMMVPEGFKVELLRDSGGYDFLNLINHHNHMMSESVLANFFDKDTGGGSGESGALVNFAQPGDDMFVLMLRSIMDDIASHINHFIIPQIIDYNFKGGKYPEFTWGAFTEEQKAAIAATFDKLASTPPQSMSASREFFRALEKEVSDEMGLEIDWDAVEAREEEERMQQQAMGLGPDGTSLPGAAPGTAEGALAAASPQDLEMSDEELESVTSLSDVLDMIADKANEAAIAQGQPTVDEDVEPDGQTVTLAGISDDMLDWADHMLELTEVE